MIILGYPGIGKSTLGGRNKFIDLDSSVFKENVDSDCWEVVYCETAKALSAQGYKVLISTHETVRNILCMDFIDNIFVVVPTLDLEQEWATKLKNRYFKSKSEPDRLAYERSRDHFKEDVKSLLSSPFHILEIESLDYDLKDMLSMKE